MFQNFLRLCFLLLLLHIRVKLEEKNEKKFESILFNWNDFSLKYKNIILCCPQNLFFHKWSYSLRCFDFMQRCSIDSENGSAALTLFNVVELNVEMENVDSIFFNVIIPTLTYKTLFQR